MPTVGAIPKEGKVEGAMVEAFPNTDVEAAGAAAVVPNIGVEVFPNIEAVGAAPVAPNEVGPVVPNINGAAEAAVAAAPNIDVEAA